MLTLEEHFDKLSDIERKLRFEPTGELYALADFHRKTWARLSDERKIELSNNPIYKGEGE